MTASPEAPAQEGGLDRVEVFCRGPWRQASSLRFILPVRYPEDTFSARAAAVGSATLPGRQTPLWRPYALPADDLMPHVRRYLNADGGDASTGTLLTADINELTWLTGGDGAVWTLLLSRNRRRDFRVTGAHLMLFRLDIAFLVVDVEPVTSSAADWFDVLHFGRFVSGNRRRPVELACADTAAGSAALRVLGPTAEAATAAAENGGRPRLRLRLPGISALVDVLLARTLLGGESLATVQQLNTPGQMLAYPVLFLAAAPQAGPDLVARVVGSHHAERSLRTDSALALDQAVLAYGETSWLFTSTEGAGFLAVASEEVATQFTQQVLPAHLRTEYFIAYLLAAFQRYALLTLSEQVAEGALMAERRFAVTQARVLEFTGRAMFTQVTHSPHHQAWYRHVQTVHQVAQLHQEVRDEVQAFQDFERAHESERNERRSRSAEVMVAVITGVIIPLQLVAALFADQVHEWPLLRQLSPAVQAYSTLAVGVSLAAVIYLVLRVSGRKERQEN